MWIITIWRSLVSQLDKHYKHLVLPDRPASKPAQQHNSGIPAATHAAAAAAGGASAAQPLGAQSGAVHHSKRRGLFTIEDDCDHATWLTQCVHFEPGKCRFPTVRGGAGSLLTDTLS